MLWCGGDVASAKWDSLRGHDSVTGANPGVAAGTRSNLPVSRRINWVAPKGVVTAQPATILVILGKHQRLDAVLAP